MIKLAIAGAVAIAWVVLGLRRRGTLRREVARRGWRYVAQDDALARTWTMPPFAHLRSPADAQFPHPTRVVQVSEVVTFLESGSTAYSMLVSEGPGDGPSASTHHLVALHTRQGLPRTIARAGIDVYVLPAYEGLHRVLEPKHWTRGGIISILSEDPDTARRFPFDRLTRDLSVDSALTVVADGDWIYAYRPGRPTLSRIDAMIVTVQKLARGIDGTRWPGPENPHANVYGAV